MCSNWDNHFTEGLTHQIMSDKKQSRFSLYDFARTKIGSAKIIGVVFGVSLFLAIFWAIRQHLLRKRRRIIYQLHKRLRKTESHGKNEQVFLKIKEKKHGTVVPLHIISESENKSWNENYRIGKLQNLRSINDLESLAALSWYSYTFVFSRIVCLLWNDFGFSTVQT